MLFELIREEAKRAIQRTSEARVNRDAIGDVMESVYATTVAVYVYVAQCSLQIFTAVRRTVTRSVLQHVSSSVLRFLIFLVFYIHCSIYCVYVNTRRVSVPVPL